MQTAAASVPSGAQDPKRRVLKDVFGFDDFRPGQADAMEALLAGRHVVVDKPCAVTLKETHSLLALASQQGRVLTVFQNRRLDSDFLAVQKVLQSGVLGRVVEVESHFDRFRPQVPQRWRDQALAGAGLWFDLGAHLLDQVLCLWGMPSTLYLDQAKVRSGALVDD